MIGKLKKGSSFGGCIRYVTGKDEAKIIASDGVLLGTNAEMTQSFELQRQLNPRIKKPVGHIALSFKPEDKPRLTDEFMAKIALEYMQMMGINDTQFIIVRHHNTDNPHCHIVYNRINNESKLLSDRNDYRRNEQVTKALKSKYGLTYGTDKSKTNTRKLRNAERAKYEIHNAVKGALKAADSWHKFKNELAKRGTYIDHQHDRQLPFFLEDLHIRTVVAGSHIPVDIPDIVAVLIFSYLTESHTSPLKGRMIFAGKNIFGQAPGFNLYLPDPL